MMIAIGMNNLKLRRNGGEIADSTENCHIPPIVLPFLGELDNLESFLNILNVKNGNLTIFKYDKSI